MFVQVCVFALLSVLRPDPAYGVYGTLFFASFFNIIGTVCGLVGYALAAAFLSSSATAALSCAAGGMWALAAMAGVYSTVWFPASAQLLGAASLCAALGAVAYWFVNHARSNYRIERPREP